MYTQQNVTQQPVTVQYRGMQKPYEPVGFVQSFYGQNQQQQFQPYATSMVQRPIAQPQLQYGMTTQQIQSYPTPEAYHTANYRGNQVGHDQYLRADSVQPTSYSMVQPQYQQSIQPQYQQSIQPQQIGQQTLHFQPQAQPISVQSQYPIQQPQQLYQQTVQPQQIGQQTQPYQTAFHGNQIGQYLRAQSVYPTQTQFQTTLNRPVS